MPANARFLVARNSNECAKAAYRMRKTCVSKYAQAAYFQAFPLGIVSILPLNLEDSHGFRAHSQAAAWPKALQSFRPRSVTDAVDHL
jgi:hypothetical protein